MSSTGSDGFGTSMISELYQLTKSLQQAIRSGDEGSAKALVQKLTLMKAPVVINLEEATPPSTNIRFVHFEHCCTLCLLLNFLIYHFSEVSLNPLLFFPISCIFHVCEFDESIGMYHTSQ